MKKILIFSLAYYPRFTSGAEAAVREITDRNLDIEFYMITLRFGKEDLPYEKVSNVHVYRVGFGSFYLNKMLFPLLAALKGISLHKKHHFDAVWAMMTYMLLPVALMRVFGTRIPHMLTLQDGDPYDKVFERWFIRPITPLLDLGFRKAKVIQVISTFLGTWPPKRGYAGPIELIYNGANPKDLHPEDATEAIKAIHQKWGKKEGDIWLVNTARLVYQKAFDDVIRALPELPENVKFLIVGSGEDEKMLKDLAEELNVTDRVMFTGQIDRSEVTLYRRASDIFVMPSRSEGLGNAGLSAMASRLPMIATREGGLAEYVVDGETGWVVEKDKPEDIARAVKDILANPEKVEKITENARKMVLEKYDWDKVAEQMRTRVFKRLLEKEGELTAEEEARIIKRSASLMEDGEIRIRMLDVKDNSGCILTMRPGGSGGAWQNSHSHTNFTELYMVQSGWMGYGVLQPGGTVSFEVYREGQFFLTRKNEAHNIYLPEGARIYTIKYSDAEVGKDWSASPELDRLTKDVSEEELLRLAS